jgi:hypothetical protein
MLFGMVIGLMIFAFIIIIVNWFPCVGKAWMKNNSQVRSVYFTVVLYAVWASRLWRWQRRSALVFWASLGIIFLLHAVLLYSTHFHPLLIGEWLVLAAAESIVIVFGVDWLTRRFSHSAAIRRTGETTLKTDESRTTKSTFSDFRVNRPSSSTAR